MSEMLRGLFCTGKSCWRASLALQQLLLIQTLLIFMIIKLLQILYSNATDLKLGSSTYFSCSSFLVFKKCQVFNLKVG